MHFRKLTLAAAATTLAIAPVASQAAPVARAAARLTDEADLGGSDAVRALIIILIAAIGMVFLLLTDDDDNPVSAVAPFAPDAASARRRSA